MTYRTRSLTYRFAVDGQGAPLLFGVIADAPPESVADEQAKAHASTARRRDAVVDAARTLDDLSTKGIEQHARRRWRGDRPITIQDIKSFSDDARAQRVHDVSDAIDHRIKQGIYGRAGSKQTHTSIPRGRGVSSLASLDDSEIASVVERLRGRGWEDNQIKRYVRRLDKSGRVRAVIGGDKSA